MSHVTNLICNRELKASDIVCTHIYQVYKESAMELVDSRLVDVMNYLIKEVFKDYCVLINNWSGNQSVEVMQKFPDVHYYEERGMRCNLCKSSLDRTKRGEVVLEPHHLGKAVDFTVYYKSGYQASVGDSDVEKYQTTLNEEFMVPPEEVRKMIEDGASGLPYHIRLDYSLEEWVHLDVLEGLTSDSLILKMGNQTDPEIIDGSTLFPPDDLKFIVYNTDGLFISSPVDISKAGKINVGAAKINSKLSKERIPICMRYLMSKGISKEKAAGIVGNLACEGLMVVDLGNVYNDGAGGPYEGPSAGIAGFHAVWKGWWVYKNNPSEFERVLTTEVVAGNRGELGGLIKFCKSRGLKWNALEAQLEYIVSGSKAAKTAISKMQNDPEHAAKMWGYHYERFSGYLALYGGYKDPVQNRKGWENYAKRVSYALAAYKSV